MLKDLVHRTTSFAHPMQNHLQTHFSVTENLKMKLRVL